MTTLIKIPAVSHFLSWHCSENMTMVVVAASSNWFGFHPWSLDRLQGVLLGRAVHLFFFKLLQKHEHEALCYCSFSIQTGPFCDAAGQNWTSDHPFCIFFTQRQTVVICSHLSGNAECHMPLGCGRGNVHCNVCDHGKRQKESLMLLSDQTLCYNHIDTSCIG